MAFGDSEARAFGGDGHAGFELEMRGRNMHKVQGQRSTNTSHAFTRLELLACIFGCGLVMAVILPGLANSTARSDRVLCVNRLRQIGVAYANFGLERHDLPPWRLPTSEGGNNNHPLKNHLFVQFAVLSNWLATPKPLADPSDQRRAFNPARHWGTTEGGLWNPSHHNNAVSYFLGIDGTFRAPRAVLSGDRNLSNDGWDTHGSSLLHARINTATAEWTNAVHGFSGNLLLFDGSVEQTDTRRMREAFQNGQGDRDTNGVVKNARALMTFY
jgi:prepilin-type processing-associated H-X9-DG protein